MTRIVEFGSSEIDGIQQLDLHDKSIPLVDRVEFMLIFMGKCNSDDFLCTEEEIAVAINKLENREVH